MSLHVGLDLLFLVPGESGGRETHVRGLLGALREARPDLRLTTFVGADAAGPGFWTEHADRTVVLPRASAPTNVVSHRTGRASRSAPSSPRTCVSRPPDSPGTRTSRSNPTCRLTSG